MKPKKIRESIKHNAKKEKDGKCKLCCKPSILRSSHIIPEFMYADLYDEKHRSVYITSESEDRTKFFQQKGIRERLLCQKCESKLAVWEKHGKEVLDIIRKRQPLHNIVNISKGADYTHFKLFLNSLLWRMSISTSPFFGKVSLNSRITERLRLSLRSDNPGKEKDLPCQIKRLIQGDYNYNSKHISIMPISWEIPSGQIVVSLVIYELFFSWRLSPNCDEISEATSTLSEMGDIWVECEKDDELIQMMERIALDAVLTNPKVRSKWEKDTGI